ncbi:MAG: emp24/gp25L/p24 family protein [Candidatus Bathyarchaeota archaeon]|nr:MAG: emp24/gp25L/p24 family protein [Candidatus Bathyarchaeota archaeon]
MKIATSAAILYLAYLLFLSVGFVQAASESFSLDGNESVSRPVNLSAGDELYVKLIVETQHNMINFTLLSPENRVVLEKLNVASAEFKLKILVTGEYRFLFENLYSSESKHITFYFSVQHFILGYPQEMVLLFATAFIVLGAIVVFVAMSPKP